MVFRLFLKNIFFLCRTVVSLRHLSLCDGFCLIFIVCAFAPSGMAVLSMSVQHFLGGLITTLTFTTMMHCTQRAEESIQVKQPSLGSLNVEIWPAVM